MAIAYYNEIDPFAAQWLRNLIDAGHIAPGVVDTRSIEEVTANDLKGFTQCHFFAGIGGWSYALRRAGVSDSYKCWTGSPPCQPFSSAGKQLGQLDKRHLAPVFLRLITECKPPVVFGEQVAAAIRKHWLDDLFVELEKENYACGAAVLPAASVGAPHKRERLYFGAHKLADTAGARHMRGESAKVETGAIPGQEQAGELQARSGRHPIPPVQQSTGVGKLAESMRSKWDSERIQRPRESDAAKASGAAAKITGCGDSREPTDSNHGFWSGADWLRCKDAKYRPVEPGTFPLANGISARVGRLRGYGNAIVPQVAAEFVIAFLDSLK